MVYSLYRATPQLHCSYYRVFSCWSPQLRSCTLGGEPPFFRRWLELLTRQRTTWRQANESGTLRSCSTSQPDSPARTTCCLCAWRRSRSSRGRPRVNSVMYLKCFPSTTSCAAGTKLVSQPKNGCMTCSLREEIRTRDRSILCRCPKVDGLRRRNVVEGGARLAVALTRAFLAAWRRFREARLRSRSTQCYDHYFH